MKIKSRKKKLLINTYISIIEQIIILISGFILPRLILTNFGSEVNGLISSITQFISIIALLELGVGAVIQSSLYKPIATGNKAEMSRVLKSGRQFFNKIGIIFIFYLFVLALVYPKFVDSFDWLYVLSLIFILSISSIFQYFVGISYQLLLFADQRAYVAKIISVISIIFNTIISIFLIRVGATIQVVKLFSASIFLFKPLLINLYIKIYYEIDKDIVIYEEPLKQKWNGMAQHVASFVLQNTDIMVLTVFSSLSKVSIYAVYNLVITGVKKTVMTFTTGFQALFGNMLANEEYEKLIIRFEQFEWGIHTVVTLLFTCTALLITPFISIYTKGIQDANYIQPLFGFILSIAVASYCLRLPYNIIVLAAGHYKETQLSAIIEMMINLLISVALIVKFGLIGVAVGTLFAMIYRTVYLAMYISKNIINYKFKIFLKNIIVDSISAFAIVLISTRFKLAEINYYSWIRLSVKVFCIASLVIFIINSIFYKDKMKSIYSFVRKKLVTSVK